MVEAPPQTEAELLARAEHLAGSTLAEVARLVGKTVPLEMKRAKGWAGTLVERALGATASSRGAPDFEHLGIELKTLPIDARGTPCESTFVCTVRLADIGDVEWERSRVRQKLARVLWFPVQGERHLALGERRLGTPFIWSPTPNDEALLRFDWEELNGVIALGDYDRITGKIGKFLQVRPKAENSRARTPTLQPDGSIIRTLPRGFYLRKSFTARILRHFFPSDVCMT